MDLDTTYEYVVLRVQSNPMRGEAVNIGLAIFCPDRNVEIRLSAPLQKIRSVHPKWTTDDVQKLRMQIESIATASESTEERVRDLVSLGFCQQKSAGFFDAASLAEKNGEIARAEMMFVTNAKATAPHASVRKPKLQRELISRFKTMGILGRDFDDLQNHQVVANVPVPEHPGLKSDFLFKNGIYRLTQTIDYRVAEKGAHQKINEVCTKTMAAQVAEKYWGASLAKFAIVSVPSAIQAIAEPHIEMLKDSGFRIFTDKDESLSAYHQAALTYQ